MAASTQGHATIAAALIAHGAAVDAKDKNNWSALLRASDKGHTDIVNLLIAHGADPVHTDRVSALLFVRVQPVSYILFTTDRFAHRWASAP